VSILDKVNVRIKSLKAGWVASNLVVREGDVFSISSLSTIANKLPKPWQAKYFLWFKIGENGQAENLAFNDDYFSAKKSGEIFIAINLNGKLFWKNRMGKFSEEYDALPDSVIDVNVKIINWVVEENFTSKLSDDENIDIAQSLLKNKKDKKKLPFGFQYIWELGQGNIFEAFSEDNRSGVHAETIDEAGIIKFPMDIALRQDIQIRFDWLYHRIPAVGSETLAHFHDYASIAVEFDNGQDITWFWSRDLEPMTFFRCPLSGWEKIETHIVLQSGTKGLGEWHSHERNLVDDYLMTVGGKLPKKIVGVWIIGNSVFQRQHGEARFANIKIIGEKIDFEIFK